MKIPTILCDVDEVIADLLGEWVRCYNEAYDDDLSLDSLTSWDMSEHVKTECGKDIYAFLADKWIYTRVSPIYGAMQGVRELRRLGRVVFVTSSNPATMHGKVRWLEHYGFLSDDPRHSDLIIAHDKSLIRGDVLIDDGPHNVKAFPGDTILVDRPYNRDLTHPYRATSWEEIVELTAKIVG